MKETKTETISLIKTCINCGKHFEGNYCSNCGQESDTEKFTMKKIGQLFAEGFSLEKGVLYLIGSLTIYPQKIIKSYLKGYRVKIYDPLKYLLLSSAILAFLNIIFKPSSSFSASVGDSGTPQNINIWMSNYMSLLIILVQPLYATVTKLLFKENKLNYAENIILNCFIYAQVNIINSAIILSFFWLPNYFIQSSSLLVTIFYPTFAYFKMSDKYWVWKIFKVIFGSLLNTLILIILIALLIIFDFSLFEGTLGLVKA